MELPSPEARLILLDDHGRPSLTEPGIPGARGLQDDYDVLHYDLNILLDPARELVDGTCTITMRSLVSALSVVELDLHFPEYVVRSVERVDRPGTRVEVYRDADKLMLELGGDLPGPNDELVLAINYVGRPRDLPGVSPAISFESGAIDGLPRAHSFAEPSNARGWWPCKDRPDDKATIDLHVEAPQSMSVVANGSLHSIVSGRDGFRVSTWRHDYPVATYLVGFSAGFFARQTEPWDWVDDRGAGHRMIVSYWAWPELADWAFQDFARTVPMIDALSERFGLYPFAREKYGIVLFGEDGGMEHQTATGIGGSVIALSRGSGAIENVLVHELAHHWWGNSVGITDFESVWLKEGLATWSEALWWEENGGLPSYLEYMEDLSRPLGAREFPGTVHAPVETFGSTVYFKGAWVMHMLRFVLSGPSRDGDPEPLFELLRTWAADRAGETATTQEFVDFISRETPAIGSIGGAPLSEWFFPQWLEREGRPRYAIDHASHPAASGIGWTTHLRVEQRQAGEPYAMPLHLRLHADSGVASDRVFFVSSETKDLTAWTEDRIVSVELDPLGWVLKERVESAEIDLDDDGWPDWLDDCPEVADPEQGDENDNGLADACEPGLDFDGDGRPNEDDCAPADGEAWAPPLRDTVLRVTHDGPGLVRLAFDHPPAEGQRPYRVDLAIGSLTSLRRDGSMASASCLETALEGEGYESLLSFGGLGTYWVAVPRNGCPEEPGPSTRSNPCP